VGMMPGGSTVAVEKAALAQSSTPRPQCWRIEYPTIAYATEAAPLPHISISGIACPQNGISPSGAEAGP